MPVEMAEKPPWPLVAAISRNAWTMPMTVPKRPMKGAVVAMVARLPTPRFSSLVVWRVVRSRARPVASITSAAESPRALFCWKVESPAATTRATWL